MDTSSPAASVVLGGFGRSEGL